MENREPQIFMNPEIKSELNKADQKIEERELYLARATKLLVDSTKLLDESIESLEYMNEGDEFTDEYYNKLGKQSAIKKHSPEFILRTQKNIEIAKQNVADANVLIAGFTLDSIEAKVDKEKLERLNQKFKDDLLKLESFNLN